MRSESELVACFDSIREDSSEFVILEGLHAIKHAWRFGAEIVFLGTDELDAILQLTDRVATDLRPFLVAEARELSSSLISRLVRRTTRKTVVGVARRPLTASAREVLHATGHSVLLERPTDHGNLGAVIRVAAAANAVAVLTCGGVEPWHPASIRGSAGLHFAVPVLAVKAVPGVVPIVALTPGAPILRPDDVPRSAIFAFGSERSGLSADLTQRAELRFGIPMVEGVSSLNLATAVAIVLYGCGPLKSG